LNGKRLCAENTESEPFELSQGDNLEFGIDILDENGARKSLFSLSFFQDVTRTRHNLTWRTGDNKGEAAWGQQKKTDSGLFDGSPFSHNFLSMHSASRESIVQDLFITQEFGSIRNIHSGVGVFFNNVLLDSAATPLFELCLYAIARRALKTVQKSFLLIVVSSSYVTSSIAKQKLASTSGSGVYSTKTSSTATAASAAAAAAAVATPGGLSENIDLILSRLQNELTRSQETYADLGFLKHGLHELEKVFVVTTTTPVANVATSTMTAESEEMKDESSASKLNGGGQTAAAATTTASSLPPPPTTSSSPSSSPPPQGNHPPFQIATGSTNEFDQSQQVRTEEILPQNMHLSGSLVQPPLFS